MSCNSAIYTVNSSNTSVTTSNNQFVQIPFGSAVRRFGRALALDGGNIVCMGSGYFDCSLSLTVSPTATTPITVQLFQDGVAVPGALATATAPTAGNPVNLSIESLIRNCGCNCNSVLSVCVNADCTVENAGVVIKKL